MATRNIFFTGFVGSELYNIFFTTSSSGELIKCGYPTLLPFNKTVAVLI